MLSVRVCLCVCVHVRCKSNMSAYMNHASSSSSEDEAENQRLLDAVWDHNRRDEAKVRPTQSGGSEENSRPRQMMISKPSVREMIYQESYDQFNEDHKNVKATPEFRSFVAKKLSSVLDGKLKMTVSNKQKTFHNDCSEEMEKDNFRLFSTSCCAPNLHTPEPPPPPVKRKRPRIGRNTKKISQANHDDSDSDVEEQRLAEAAISGHQILSFSAMSASSGHHVEKVECSSDDDIASCLDSERRKTDTAFNKSDVEVKDRELSEDDFSETAKKKKKKKKRKEDTCLQMDVELSEEKDQSDLSEELVKRKKRKKKRKRVAVNANKEDNHEHSNIENC